MVWLMSCLGCSIDEYLWFYKSHLHIYYPWMGCGLHYDIFLKRILIKLYIVKEK